MIAAFKVRDELAAQFQIGFARALAVFVQTQQQTIKRFLRQAPGRFVRHDFAHEPAIASGNVVRVQQAAAKANVGAWQAALPGLSHNQAIRLKLISAHTVLHQPQP
jgi:hypothetical protein